MEQLVPKATKYCEHMQALCKAPCSLFVTEPGPQIRHRGQGLFCDTCGGCDPVNAMHYGCSEAYRWNGKYVFYCPKGLVFIAASLSGGNALCGGLLAGPVVMGDVNDTLAAVSEESLKEAIAELPVFDTAHVRHTEAILSVIAGAVSDAPQGLYGNYIYEQEKLLSELYEMKNDWQSEPGDSDFLIKREKQLYSLIANKNKDGAQQLLNEMLGYIFFTSNADLPSIKARLIEMLVLLSRSAIDAGAGIQEILLFNKENIRQISATASMEELSTWITGILHRFVQYSFDFTGVKHSDALYKVMQYVKANYDRKITLDDIASHVCLSRSYISSIFKEETGEGLFSYINRVRVEKSKTLLLNEAVSLVNIGGLCGFEDQSYFTKVFKSIVGISPKKYRDCRGNVTAITKNV